MIPAGGEFRARPLLMRFAQAWPHCMGLALRGFRNSGEREFGVGHCAQFRRIVASDFRRIDIDVNQPRGWNVESKARIPRTGIRFGETRARGKDQIRVAAEGIRDGSTPETSHPEQQRMIFPQAAFTHQRMSDGNFESFRQRACNSAVARDERTPPPA